MSDHLLTAFREVRARVRELTCDEASSGTRCGQSAGYVAELPGIGHVVVCSACARFYAAGSVRRLALTRDACIAAGNLLDQIEDALERAPVGNTAQSGRAA